jgi:hypothetical protein
MKTETRSAIWSTAEERASARRRVGKVVREWEATFRWAQLASTEDLADWLNECAFTYVYKRGTWPTDAAMRGWARQFARLCGFHGANAREAGERNEPLHEIPCQTIHDEEDFENLRAHSAHPVNLSSEAGSAWDTRCIYPAPRHTRQNDEDEEAGRCDAVRRERRPIDHRAANARADKIIAAFLAELARTGRPPHVGGPLDIGSA